MSSQTILCPHCKHSISLDEALTAHIRSAIEGDLQLEMQKKQDALRKELEQKSQEEKAQFLEKMKKDIHEESKQKMEFLEQELEEKKKKLAKSQEIELAMRKRESELEEQKRTFELTIQKKMDEERKAIREKTAVELIEANRQKEMEKDKQIADLKKLLEDAQRKANQGSQQTQGEVQELALEESLAIAFPHDRIEPVGKGINGADIKQVVRTPRGTICGTILWEVKQTKTWNEGWIAKLKNDLRTEKADIPILATATYSDPHWKGIIEHEKVWVCSFALAIPLVTSLRQILIEVGRQKAMSADRGNKADQIYNYITSQSFRQQIESLAEVYLEMHDQIRKERMSFEKTWKQREGQIQRLFTSTVHIYGTIQGLAGATAVPQIRGLETLEDGDSLSLLPSAD